MPNLARTTGRVLGWLLIFDVVGVLLTLIVDAMVVLHRWFESSSLLGYAIWFVVGVFCGVFIYMAQSSADDHDSAEGRRRGQRLVGVTAAVAAVLALLSSFVWSGSEATEAVAPDHRGVTITYLITVVLTVAWGRFVLFRGTAAAEPGSAAPVDPSGRFQRAKPRAFAPAPPLEQKQSGDAAFEPAGILKTLGFVVGVPTLLFLDASFFVLAPFDYFDRWMDPILSASLLGGLAWGVGCARWQSPREWLLVAHAPLLIGTIFFLFAILLGGLLFVLGVPEGVLEIMQYVAFGAGFLLGGVAVVGWVAELFERASSEPAVRS
ncbi:MAG TPA: hypothetical protein VGL98_11555 [Gammaproteobacteria bacterium]